MFAHRSALALVAAAALLGCDKTSLPAPEPTHAPPATSAAPERAPATSALPTDAGAPPMTAADPPLKADLPSSKETAPLAAANNQLAFELYGQLRATPGNAVFSPTSISSALAMTYGGARGKTLEELKKVLHFQAGPAEVAQGWGGLQRGLTSPDRTLKLRIANRLFGEQTYTFEKPFLDLTRTAYGAPLEAVDFKKGAEPARVRINGWIAQQTDNRIKDLIPLGATTSDTSLVLVNAIYFLADWASPFKKEATSADNFTTSGGAKKKVPMMHQTASLRVGKRDGVSVIELPYVNETASMVVLLPERLDGLDALERSLSGAKLDSLRRGLTSKEVNLALPRFEVSPPAVDLSGALGKLGMTLAFDSERADFTGMANPPNPRDRLHIDKVFHKAFVKVDEKGTEAAAATAVIMGTVGAAPAPAMPFIVDHPFLFAIVDRTTGLVLFVGRVNDPSAS